MGKIILFLLLSMGVVAQEHKLKQDCLSCHKAQQIPSNLIYRRYLMKYSTDARMKESMFRYLKNPNKASSIMPPQFFLKFPMKKPLLLNDDTLKQDIQRYLDRFDVRNKLVLQR